MIYFVLAVLVLGQAVQNGALLELTGEAAGVEFGGALTLIHNSTEDELVCSGKIRASDVVIEGTLTTVADLIGQMAILQEDMAAMKRFVGMMPPPSVLPSSPMGPCSFTFENQTVGECSRVWTCTGSSTSQPYESAYGVVSDNAAPYEVTSWSLTGQQGSKFLMIAGDGAEGSATSEPFLLPLKLRT